MWSPTFGPQVLDVRSNKKTKLNCSNQDVNTSNEQLLQISRDLFIISIIYLSNILEVHIFIYLRILVMIPGTKLLLISFIYITLLMV